MSIQGSAIAVNGQQAVRTTDVVNTLMGEKELLLSYTNTAGGAQDTVTIKSGAWRASGEVLDGGGTNSMTAGDFTNNQQLQAYFRTVVSAFAGVHITTDDTDNLLNGYFQVIEKDPTGHEVTVKKRIAPKYIQPLGGGTYALESTIPASDFSQILWAGLELQFVSLKPGTTISFTFYMKGWSKPAKLSQLSAAMI